MKVRRITIAAAFLAAVLLFAGFQSSSVEAQIGAGLPGKLGTDPYIMQLDNMFGDWNAKKLQLPSKSKLQPVFEDHLREIVKERKYPYQDQSWANSMRKKFAELPEQIRPEKPLTPYAQMVLTLIVSERLPEFKRRVRPEKVREQLDLPLFMILGRAQIVAIKAGEENIATSRILESLFWWWTTIWPFCS